MSSIVYFSTNIESVGRRKYLLFLEKCGYEIVKVQTFNDFEEALKYKAPGLLIINEESRLDEIVKATKLPIIMILKSNKNISALINQTKDIENTIFYRHESDPIETILETVKFGFKIKI